MTFTLTVRPDGKAILSTTETLRPEQIDKLREKFAEWSSDEKNRTILLSETEVVRIEDVELDLGS